MNCPFCSRKTKVTHTGKKTPVLRRRKCKECNCIFQTSETIVLPPSLRVSKAGNREVEHYDRQKIVNTILWFSKKHKLTPRDREEIIREVEYKLLALGQDVVSTGHIAEFLFISWSQRSPKAAKRFASNYVDENGQLVFQKDTGDFRRDKIVIDTPRQLNLFKE